jgi:hypothetical protein
LLFAIEGRVGQRKLWGIVSLAERYPRRLVNSACARALADGIYSYRHVKAATEKLVAEALAARLVTGLITERGVCAASEAGLLSLFPEQASPA